MKTVYKKSQQKSTQCEYYTQKCFSHFVHVFLPRLLLQRFGRWSLGNPGTSAPAHGMPSRLPPRDCVSRSDQIMAPALARSNARLSVALRDHPGHTESREGTGSLRSPRRLRPATSRYRTRSSRGFLTYVDLRSHARESENA